MRSLFSRLRGRDSTSVLDQSPSARPDGAHTGETMPVIEEKKTSDTIDGAGNLPTANEDKNSSATPSLEPQAIRKLDWGVLPIRKGLRYDPQVR